FCFSPVRLPGGSAYLCVPRSGLAAGPAALSRPAATDLGNGRPEFPLAYCLRLALSLQQLSLARTAAHLYRGIHHSPRWPRCRRRLGCIVATNFHVWLAHIAAASRLPVIIIFFRGWRRLDRACVGCPLRTKNSSVGPWNVP